MLNTEGYSNIPVTEEDSTNSNVCMNLDANSFHVVSAVGASSEIG